MHSETMKQVYIIHVRHNNNPYTILILSLYQNLNAIKV